jgi:hypothetical protein
MAATGLLGINPYQKGVAIDIASKPINLVIQLEQKERAKREALDKYLMDYEKTLNPNGMRQQDQNAFLSKLGEAKQYYLQNRDKILNPAKYGAEYQSTYNAGLREAQSLIGQSKQAAAGDKITSQHFIAQKDLNAPDGYAEAVEASHLPINDPRYRPLDVTQYRFYKSYNPMEYANKVYSKIPLSEGAPVSVDLPGDPSQFYTKTVSTISPKYKESVLQQGFVDYANDEGLRKEMNNVFNTNKEEVKRLETKYGVKIPNAQALSGYNLWDLQPVKEATSGISEKKAFARAQELAKSKSLIDYNNQNQSPTTHLFDIFGSGTGLTTKNADIKDGTAFKKDGSLYDGEITIAKEQLPSDFSAALSAAGISKDNLDNTEYVKVKYKDGKATSVSSELIGTINADQMARYQDALNKKIYGVKGAITRTTAVPKTSGAPKKETLAERMRRQNKNK